MNIFKLFNQASPAEPWIEAMIIRETQKNGGQPIQLTEEQTGMVTQSGYQIEHNPNTVCTLENFKKTEEETGKIRRVHDELAELIFKPALAI